MEVLSGVDKLLSVIIILLLFGQDLPQGREVLGAEVCVEVRSQETGNRCLSCWLTPSVCCVACVYCLRTASAVVALG